MQINSVGVERPTTSGVGPGRAKPLATPTSEERVSNVASTDPTVSESTDVIKVMAENVRAAVSAAHVLGRDVTKTANGAVLDVSI